MLLGHTTSAILSETLTNAAGLNLVILTVSFLNEASKEGGDFSVPHLGSPA